MRQEAINCTITITVDSDTKTYQSRRNVHVAPRFQNRALPRDVVLALISELELLGEWIVDKTGITEEEMKIYLEERKIITQDTSSPAFETFLEDEDSADI